MLNRVYKKSKQLVKRGLRVIGPGFISGASDDDPSGIATYSQTGALFGYSQLWMALFSLPFMTVIQVMSGRIGLVTGKGLARVIREYYSRPALYVVVTLLFIVNVINIGANLGAMAASAQLLIQGIPFLVWLAFMTVLILALEIFVSYKRYANVLKYLAFSLFAYVVVAFVVKQDWGMVLRSAVIPSIRFDHEYLMNIVAILGTTISPYLFFWQASQEVEEGIAHRRATKTAVRPPIISWGHIVRLRLDTVVGMLFSNVIMFFIIITAAATLHAHGITWITTADQAAEALRPLAGDLTFVLFAAGIIGTGLLSVPVLAGSASYAVAETFNLKEGLYRSLRQAEGFYGVIVVATVAGLLINLTPLEPFQLLYFTAILNGLAAPILMYFIVRIARNQKIMGEYVSSRRSEVLGWIITAIMGAIGVALIASFVVGR